ncbi:MAG: hypothetical protein ACK4RZ_18120 [Paracoccaceae bacterium]
MAGLIIVINPAACEQAGFASEGWITSTKGDQFPNFLPACIHSRQDLELSASKIVIVPPRTAERAPARSPFAVHHQHNTYSATHTTFLTSRIAFLTMLIA